MSDLLRVAVDAAREAGALLLERRSRVRSVEAKDDRSLVSDVDRAAEALLRERIAAAFPGHAVLGEEGGGACDDEATVWVLDPLDGTHNYLRGLPLFGVSVAVVRRGEFVVGVIDVPAEGLCYAAEKGCGAWRGGERIGVSRRADPATWTVGLDSDLRTGFPAKAAVLERLGRSVFNLRMLGSSARSLSLVAEGSLDGLVEFFDQPWDFAAGVTLVGEAGGRFTALDGGPPRCAPGAYVAAGSAAHPWLLDVVARVGYPA